MMKRIGILTFHASHNYGSMLQAWALQQFLTREGHDVEIINFRSEVQRQKVYPHPLEQQGTTLVKNLLAPKWLYHQCRQWRKYEEFMTERMNLSERMYRNWNELREDLRRYDTVITGGDQIWNMSCPDFDQAYFLPGKLDGVRKVAYGPSCGNFLPGATENQKEFIKEQLSDYDALSAREAETSVRLAELTGRAVKTVVDPTMLLRAEDYAGIVDGMPRMKGSYALYYTPNRRIDPKAQAICIQLGLTVVTTCPGRYRNHGMTLCYEAGLAEFLNLLKNATLVVGSSYHMVLFSLLYHKEFVVTKEGKDVRIANLLNILGLSGRMTLDGDVTIGEMPPIDYTRIDPMIDSIRKTSAEFLSENL